MIIDKKKKGNVTIYYVDKDYEDAKLNKVLNKKLKPNQIKNIIDEDADVYTKDGELLLRFRKNKLNKKNVDDFYENVIKFAVTPTNNRGSASGSKSKNNWDNPQIMTNIIGFFDRLSPRQKFILKQQGKTLKTSVRQCRFNMDYPEKYEKLLPLIKQIDEYYKKYIPDKYKNQRKKADQTPFKIEGTSFTTITTNVNFQTTVHTDKGDDIEGFGNLSVIEHGKYKGGETCFPQYGIGVNVRSGDILYMDVHQPHGNLPLILETKDSKRLSIVCYLREKLWEKTKGKTKKFMIEHNNMIKNARKSGQNKTKKNR
jgi:hypothetical protein